jgi:uncharacterized protein with predicted RNA binding PUA domain
LKDFLIDPLQKISYQIDFLFGKGISSILPPDIEIEYSKKTGKIKNFSLNGKLIGTFRSDGGIALTIYGSKLFLQNKNFYHNCIIPIEDVVPFVSEGRSLFVKHVLKCGQNVKTGSEVAILNSNQNVIAVGRSLLPCHFFYSRNNENNRSMIKGVAVKIREGIKSRSV